MPLPPLPSLINFQVCQVEVGLPQPGLGILLSRREWIVVGRLR